MRHGLGLRQTHRADRGMAEDHGRDVRVIEAAVGHAAEHPVGPSSPRRDGDRCQLSAPGDIADGVDAGDIGLLQRIDRDATGRITRHAGPIEPETLDHRLTTDGP